MKTPLVFFAAFSHIKRSTVLHVVPALRLNVFTPSNPSRAPSLQRPGRSLPLPGLSSTLPALAARRCPFPRDLHHSCVCLPFTETSAACPPRRPIGVTATAAIGVDLCIGRTPTHPRAPGAFSDRGSYRGIGQRKTLGRQKKATLTFCITPSLHTRRTRSPFCSAGPPAGQLISCRPLHAPTGRCLSNLHLPESCQSLSHLPQQPSCSNSERVAST